MIKRAISPLIILLTLAGCQALNQPLTLIPVNQVESALDNDDTSELNLPLNSKFVYDNSPEIKAALKKYASSGKAPIVKRAGFVQFPYGEVQPVLNCQPNYGCDIELQAGEHVKAVILGNAPLWDYLVWESNQQYEPVPHVTIAPRISSGRTNAIIGTNRRTYHLELLSTRKSEYIRSAKFYYPRERLREFQQREKRQKRVDARRAQRAKREKLMTKLADAGGLPYEYVSFGWEIEAPKKVRWKPVRVYDDGAHIYLQFPENIVFEDFPGVYTPTTDGKLTQPVWRTVKPDGKRSREKGTYVIVDGMFDELHLIGGFNGRREKVVIRKKQ